MTSIMAGRFVKQGQRAQRVCRSVSPISRHTDTRLAISAPPDSVAVQRDVVELLDPHPDQRGKEQLQRRHQAGGQVRGAHLGTVAELDDQRDQVDDHGDEQLGRVVEVGTVDLAQKEPEVQGTGQDREEGKDDFFEVHARLRDRKGTVADEGILPDRPWWRGQAFAGGGHGTPGLPAGRAPGSNGLTAGMLRQLPGKVNRLPEMVQRPATMPDLQGIGVQQCAMHVVLGHPGGLFQPVLRPQRRDG